MMALIATVAPAAERDFHGRQLRVAAKLEDVELTEATVLLYSLDPKGGIGYKVNTEDVFHGFRVLGRAPIAKVEDKGALVAAFARGIRESDGIVAACFNPRHGIRLIYRKRTFDFVICFECLSVMTYGFNEDRGFLTTDSPSAIFDEFVRKFHLKRSEKNG
jgi:hypothetical protein